MYQKALTHIVCCRGGFSSALVAVEPNILYILRRLRRELKSTHTALFPASLFRLERNFAIASYRVAFKEVTFSPPASPAPSASPALAIYYGKTATWYQSLSD